jgi:restriction system protein
MPKDYLGTKVLPVRSSFAVVDEGGAMARKKSLWSELQGERERRARMALAQQRTQRQMLRQMKEDHDRAERRAARAEVAERKRQDQLAHEAGTAAAKAMKAELDSRLADLRTLLTSALKTPPQLSFAMLKRPATVPPFDPGDLGKPLPVPAWEDFVPPPPGALSGLVGGKARHARAQEAARNAFEQALADHTRDEDSRVRQLQAARKGYDQQVQAIEAQVREHNAAVDELESNFQAGAPDAVEEYSVSSSVCLSTRAASGTNTRSPTGKNPGSWSSSTGSRAWM